eukprot:scaffold28520_cov124-Isochrysis_galbana.AAC.9
MGRTGWGRRAGWDGETRRLDRNEEGTPGDACVERRGSRDNGGDAADRGGAAELEGRRGSSSPHVCAGSAAQDRGGAVRPLELPAQGAAASHTAPVGNGWPGAAPRRAAAASVEVMGHSGHRTAAAASRACTSNRSGVGRAGDRGKAARSVAGRSALRGTTDMGAGEGSLKWAD